MRVGITGSYSSGKGTVCFMFQELGAVNIDTDEIAHEIVKPGKKAYNKILDAFGKDYFNSDLTLNRKLLAELVFKDKKMLQTLNNIMHPEILNTVISLSQNKNIIYVINTPLLFETGFDKYMDYNVTVIATDILSVKRGIERDKLTEKEIKMRLKNQFSINKKIELADYIIDNRESLQKTNIQVIELWKILNNLMNRK
ncbi:MAG: dephospho-CoA kinase [Spirochaetes bacterium]|nr:dephospho-CoA kinase [Spirochaetota bacterium]